ncbi:MAG: pyridoxal-5'-phosphate-dependent protein subunit beta [Chloroflexi bacterium RBG_16_57_11]|nr:MAG: pyridoxal-5'-phosphate-dependent protein subunit beta [Chloroflexi bacterium RBG_16_57_11]
MITIDDIYEARQRITPFVTRTPLVPNTTLSEQLGSQIYLKLELFQKTGSFKPRGAFNQILKLKEQISNPRVVAVSGGNFAQGVAYASRRLGVEALICMPAYTPANYIQATQSYGALVNLYPTMQETFDKAYQYQQEGWHFLHPFDNPNQMAGCGTIGLELVEDLPGMTDLFISIGGGGLISGIIVAIKALKPTVRICGIETEGSDTMGQALQAGKVVHITPKSLAKTLGAPYVAEDALRLAQEHLHRYVMVTDREAFDQEVFLLERAKINTELAASCTLAAARKVQGTFSPNDQVVLLLCGGNNSLENLVEYHSIFLQPGEN